MTCERRFTYEASGRASQCVRKNDGLPFSEGPKIRFPARIRIQTQMQQFTPVPTPEYAIMNELTPQIL